MVYLVQSFASAKILIAGLLFEHQIQMEKILIVQHEYFMPRAHFLNCFVLKLSSC